MKHILAALQKNEKLSFYHYLQDHAKEIHLEETNPHASCQYVTLEKKGEATFTLNTDKKDAKGKSIFSVFPEISIPSEQISDFIIICSKSDKVYVLLVEMKSSNTTGWAKQVANSELLIKYCLTQVEKQQSDNILHHTNIRAVLFSNEALTPFKIRKKKPLKPPYNINYSDLGNGIWGTRKPCNRKYPLGIFLKD